MSSSELHCDRTLVYNCNYHVVFCPKYRRKELVPPNHDRIKELIFEKQDEYGYAIIEVEMMPDHEHLLLDVDPRIGIDTVAGKIKGYTADTIGKEYPWMESRLPSLWTRARFIATVGATGRHAWGQPARPEFATEIGRCWMNQEANLL